MEKNKHCTLLKSAMVKILFKSRMVGEDLLWWHYIIKEIRIKTDRKKRPRDRERQRDRGREREGERRRERERYERIWGRKKQQVEIFWGAHWCLQTAAEGPSLLQLNEQEWERNLVASEVGMKEQSMEKG